MERCDKCGSMKILRNDVPTCIFCVGKKQGVAKAGYVPAIDPGEKGIQKILKDAKVEKDTLSIKTNGTPQILASNSAGNAGQALVIMKSLPMPNDVKKFRQIKKIIVQIEKLIEV